MTELLLLLIVGLIVIISVSCCSSFPMWQSSYGHTKYWGSVVQREVIKLLGNSAACWSFTSFALSLVSIMSYWWLIVLSVRVFHTQDAYAGSSTVVPNEGIFHAFIHPDDSVNFVLFHAPWCPHCQVLKPIWSEVASSSNERAFLAEVGIC